MDTPATSVDAVSGDLVISWTQPDPQGSPITSYFIEIGSKDGLTWTEHQTTCDGEDPTQLECSIDMLLLSGSPFNYI